MAVFKLIPGDMRAASDKVSEAAGGARKRDSADHLAKVGVAMPGADSVGLLSELGTSWDDELDAWADGAESFGESIAATGTDAQSTDQANGGLFAGLNGLLGGG